MPLFFLAGTDEGEIISWETASGAFINRWSGRHEGAVRAVAPNPRYDMAVSASAVTLLWQPERA